MPRGYDKNGNHFGFQKGHTKNTGRKATPEQRLTLSIAHLGQKSWCKGMKFPHLTGKNAKAWKGGRSITKNGYVRIYKPNYCKGYILEHKYKIEQKIGRRLRQHEVVHHKDGNGLNNKISNLILLTRHQHQALHVGGEKCHMAVLSEVKVNNIRKEYASGKVSCKQLAEKYGTSSCNMHLIIKRKSWKHLK